MKILFTNDDGFDAPGLSALVRWVAAKARGTGAELVIAAPLRQQSAKSHAIELHEAFEVRRLDGFAETLAINPADFARFEAYAIDSTPADCVRFAAAGLSYDFDLLFSGINNGFNVGTDILYSGTVAALFEAGVTNDKTRAIAFSADFGDPAPAVASLEAVYRCFVARDLFSYGRLFNVNLPPEPKGICLTRQGGPFYKDTFDEIRPGFFKAAGYSMYKDTADLTSDRDAALSGYISISPLTVDRTDKGAYRKLKEFSGEIF